MSRNCLLVLSIVLLTVAVPISAHSQWGPGWTRATLGTGVDGQVDYFLKVGSRLFGASYSTISVSNDDGMSWNVLDAGPVGITSLAFNNTTLFAGAGNRVTITNRGVFRSTDSGTSWALSNSGLTNTSVQRLAVHKATVFAGTLGGLFRSIDNGIIWQQAVSGIKGYDVHAIAVLNDNIFASTDSGLFQSKDEGISWNRITTLINDVAITSLSVCGRSIFAATNTMMRSTDSGTTWTEVDPNRWDLVTVSGTNLFATQADNASIVLTTDDGVTWSSVGYSHRASALGVSGPNLVGGSNNVGIWYCPIADILNSLSVETAPARDELVVSPNPTTRFITVQGTSSNVRHITITNLLGESLLEQSSPGAASFSLDLSKLPAGTYFAKIVTEEGVILKKIVKE